VGGNAQIKAMKKVAGSLKLDLAQYRELEAFAKFGSDLDKATQRTLAKGERLVELLKQGQYAPVPIEKQVLAVFAGTTEYLESVAVRDVKRYESELLEFVELKYHDIFKEISEKQVLSKELVEKLNSTLTEFSKKFKHSS